MHRLLKRTLKSWWSQVHRNSKLISGHPEMKECASKPHGKFVFVSANKMPAMQRRICTIQETLRRDNDSAASIL